MPTNARETKDLDAMTLGAIVSFHNASTGETHLGIIRGAPYSTTGDDGQLVRLDTAMADALIPIIYEFRGNIRKINKRPVDISVLLSEDGLSSRQRQGLKIARASMEYERGLKQARIEGSAFSKQSLKL